LCQYDCTTLIEFDIIKNMPNNPDRAPESEKTIFADKAKRILSKIFPGKEERIDKEAFHQVWDEETCLALKTEIEAKPVWIDSDEIISTAYNRLITLLGPSDRAEISQNNLKNRIIFTDTDTITAFLYLFEQPGDNPDIYWKNPAARMIETRGSFEAGSILIAHAVTFGKLGIIMVPNSMDLLREKDKPDREYVEKQGVSTKDFPELAFKRVMAHELTHFLYLKSLLPHRALNEPIVDYVATLVFPEIKGIDVQLGWAKVSIEGYLKELGYTSVSELTKPILQGNRTLDEISSISKKVENKYFPKMHYQTMGYPEEILNKNNLSRYSPIPE
jgi:hypothetical protein